MVRSVGPKGRIVSSLFKISALSAALIVAGCMKPPKFPRRVSVADVVNNARCELYAGVRGYFENRDTGWSTDYRRDVKADSRMMPTYLTGLKDYAQYADNTPHWLKEWAVGFDLALTVDRDFDASADTARVVPTTPGTYTLRLKASLDRDATSTFNVKFNIPNLRNWKQYNCSEQQPSTTRRRLLNGELGLKRWLDQVLPDIEKTHLQNATKVDSKARNTRREYEGEVNTLTYTIEFGVGINGNILPSWAITSSSRKQLNPMFDLGMKRLVTHKLIITMTKINVPEDPKPTDISGVVMVDDKGKEFIVSQRVCVMNSQRADLCRPEDLKDLRFRAIEDQNAEALAKTKFENSLNALKEETKKVKRIPEFQRALEAGKASPEELSRFVLPENVEGGIYGEIFKKALEKSVQAIQTPGLEIAPSIKSAIRQSSAPDQVQKMEDKLKQVLRNRLDADQAIEKAAPTKSLLKDIERIQMGARNARRRAQARAEAEARRRTEQRLDQAITNQIIRDSFRSVR